MRKLLLGAILGVILGAGGLSLGTEICDQTAGDPVFIQQDRRSPDQVRILQEKLREKGSESRTQADKSDKKDNASK